MAKQASYYSDLSALVTNVQIHKEQTRPRAKCKNIPSMCITLLSVYLMPLASLGEE